MTDDLVGLNPTVEEAARLYCRGLLNGTVVRPGSGIKYNSRTVDSYERALRLDVLPYIGAIPVVQLNKWTIQKLVDDLAEVRSPELARKAVGALRSVLSMCIREMYACESLSANHPLDGVILPTPARLVKEYGVDTRQTTLAGTRNLALSARAEAVALLMAAHPREYESLLISERTKRGLDPLPDLKNQSDSNKIAFLEAKIEWLKAKVIADQQGNL